MTKHWKFAHRCRKCKELYAPMLEECPFCRATRYAAELVPVDKELQSKPVAHDTSKMQ